MAAIFVIRTDGSALLQHRDNKKESAILIFGDHLRDHVEDNETELTCAKRELFEETNYYEKNLTFLRTVYDKTPGEPVYKVALFWCLFDYVQVPKCNEGQDLRFVSRLETKQSTHQKIYNRGMG